MPKASRLALDSKEDTVKADLISPKDTVRADLVSPKDMVKEDSPTELDRVGSSTESVEAQSAPGSESTTATRELSPTAEQDMLPTSQPPKMMMDRGGEWHCGTEETITFISSGSGLTIIISVLLFRPNWLKTLLIRIGCVQGRQPLLPQTIEPQEQGRATGSHQVVIRADRVYYNSGTDSNDEPRGRYSHPDLSENA